MTWDTRTTSWGVDTTLAPFSLSGSHLLNVRLDTAQTIHTGWGVAGSKTLRLEGMGPHEPWMEAQAEKYTEAPHTCC
jgi:hypothetical protein